MSTDEVVLQPGDIEEAKEEVAGKLGPTQFSDKNSDFLKQQQKKSHHQVVLKGSSPKHLYSPLPVFPPPCSRLFPLSPRPP